MDSSSSSSSSLYGSMLGKLVLSSGLVHSSWSKISELHNSYLNQEPGLGIKIYSEAKYTFVVFLLAPPSIPTNTSAFTLLSGSQDQNPFHFLYTQKISSFSVLTSAFQLFLSAYNQNLFDLKQKLLESKKPVIITGASLGGSVASLFTLWLLENINRRPLCITFGSPLIGDGFLQQLIENSLRNSCFLHVADVAGTSIIAGFKPFGTFLLYSDSECVCIKDPEAVMELTTGVNTDLTGWRDYGEVLDRLDRSVDSTLMIDEPKKKLAPVYNRLKKHNYMRISLFVFELYKKKSKRDKIGYYDQFKMEMACPLSPVVMEIEKYKKELYYYWKSVVEEVEKKPRGEQLMAYVFLGYRYVQIVEPLDIAEYYGSGGTDYRTSGRSHHYVMLEKWFLDHMGPQVRQEGIDLSDLTFDSCFWAEVEEAMIVINQLKIREEEELIEKVMRFEEYVWGMIGRREVSTEIFLEKSSFMKWWQEYKEIIGGRNGFNSEFLEFMNTGKYDSYG